MYVTGRGLADGMDTDMPDLARRLRVSLNQFASQHALSRSASWIHLCGGSATVTWSMPSSWRTWANRFGR